MFISGQIPWKSSAILKKKFWWHLSPLCLWLHTFRKEWHLPWWGSAGGQGEGEGMGEIIKERWYQKKRCLKPLQIPHAFGYWAAFLKTQMFLRVVSPSQYLLFIPGPGSWRGLRKGPLRGRKSRKCCYRISLVGKGHASVGIISGQPRAAGKGPGTWQQGKGYSRA